MQRRRVQRKSNMSRRTRRDNRSTALKQPVPRNPAQKVQTLLLIDEGVTFSTTGGATSILQKVLQPYANSSVNWTSWSNLYEMYRINLVTIHITPLGSVDGATLFWTQESSTIPTLAVAQQSQSTSIVNTSNSAVRINDHLYQYSGYRVKYAPIYNENSSSQLTEWTATNITTLQVPQFCAFTDLTNLGTPSAARPLFQVRVLYSVSFRGQK